LIKMPLGMEVGIGPGDFALDGDPAFPTERGTAAPTLRPMSIVAKRSPISATAELLFNFVSDFVFFLKRRRSMQILKMPTKSTVKNTSEIIIFL